MNNNHHNAHAAFAGSENHKSFRKILKGVLTPNSVSVWEVFSLTSSFNEKLPIIYANIRV